MYRLSWIAQTVAACGEMLDQLMPLKNCRTRGLIANTT
jgi:hypothetical protein